jgi:hypothetical protein
VPPIVSFAARMIVESFVAVCERWLTRDGSEDWFTHSAAIVRAIDFEFVARTIL